MKGSSFYGHGNQSPAKKALVGNQGNLPEHLKAKIDAAPGKMYDSPAKSSGHGGAEGHEHTAETRADLDKKVAKRTKLRAKEARRDAKREAGGKVLFGNLKTKMNKKKLAKLKVGINANPDAQEDLAKSKTTNSDGSDRIQQETNPIGKVESKKDEPSDNSRFDPRPQLYKNAKGNYMKR